MSRVAKVPVPIPAGVQVEVSGATVTARGPKGSGSFTVHPRVSVSLESGVLRVAARDPERESSALAGTARMRVYNRVRGVHEHFSKKLEIIWVGYRAQVQGQVLNLTLGFSHPIPFAIPEGITIETPSQTEVIVKGADKQLVGQVAANIRAWRPPEPYKGKGVKYSDEIIERKEAKKS